MVLTRHADVARAASDHETFSNVVSAHRAVPNGMDPPEHTGYRRRIEPFLSIERAVAFEPVCRPIAAQHAALVDGDRDGVARRYAAAAQCAYLDWPAATVDELVAWIDDKQAAQAASDRAALARNADAFEALVAARIAHATGLTAELATEFAAEDLASILRNWTVGEIGTIATSVSTLVGFLGERPDVRAALCADPAGVAAMVEEVLRLRGPLPSNRRVVTRDVTIGGESLAAGDSVILAWPDANRDPAAFEDADRYEPTRDLSRSLLYGVGIHHCPGAPLARVELRVFVEAYLARQAGW